MPFVEKSQLCKFSMEEAQLLSGKEDIPMACSSMHELGAGIITVTLGSEGTYVSTGSSARVIPSIKVNAVDTTGAGDAFMGCLLQQIAALDNSNAISEEDDLLFRMVKRANIAGALTTTNYGAIASLPGKETLESFDDL